MRWWFSYNEGSLCPPLLLDTFISRRLSSLWLMVIYFSHSQWPNDFQIFVLSFGQYSLRFCPHYDPWSFSFRTLNDPMISKFSSSHLDNIHYALSSLWPMVTMCSFAEWPMVTMFSSSQWHKGYQISDLSFVQWSLCFCPLHNSW
jgi:hypothetical protein